METKGKRMMVIRFSALGDVAMTLPVIYSLAERYPELDIDIVTRPFFARLFINKPTNVHVTGIDFKNDFKGIKGLLRLLKQLKSLHPDCVADLHNVSRSWIIDCYFRLRGVKVAMVDKMRGSRKRLFRTGEAQPDFIDRYAKVFSRLGFPVELTFNSLFSYKKHKPAFSIMHPAIGIAPFARYYNKIYPADMMQKVIHNLTNAGYNIYLFGGRGEEADTLKEWADKTKGCISLAGSYPLENELVLMGEMDAMISMDSSNQHMASLTGTPVISVWGSTTPSCGFMAYKQDRDNAIYLGLQCQPCSVGGSPECPEGHFNCMRKLDPGIIVNKVKEIVHKS